MMSQTASAKSPALSLLEHTPVECQTSLPIPDQKVNLYLDRHTVGVERAANQSVTLLRPMDHEPGTRSSLNPQQTSFFSEGDKVDKMDAQYESSLFSSSFSELFSTKLRLSSNIASYGHSAGTVVSSYEEEEPLESLEEIEAQTIVNLLPDDEDLFSGVTDGLDYTIHPTGGDDMDELGFFNSVGGMDLGDDGSSAAQKKSEMSTGFSNGELGLYNGAGEHRSRTLFVRNINNTVEDSELMGLFEQYGDIHTLYTACKHRGFVMISYYDIRAAQSAMTALQNKLIRRRKLDIHYSIPKQDNPSRKDTNRGTLVVFNHDSYLLNDELHQIFGVYGEIKEIHEAPHKIHHKFIEFYDTRAAEAAFRALNRSDIARPQIKLEPSHSEGSRQCLENQFHLELEQDESGPCLQETSPPNKSTNEFPGAFGSSSGSTDNGIVSGRMESISMQSGLAKSGHLQGPFKFDIRSTPSLHLHSLPDHDGLTNGASCHSLGPMAANINIKPPDVIDNRQLSRISSSEHSIILNEGVFRSTGSGICPLPGHQYDWSNSYRPQPPGMMWPNSPSMVNGICNTYSPTRLHGLPRAPSHMVNTVLPVGNHHVGSAPAVDPSLWERHHAYVGESLEASGLHPGSLGRVRIYNNNSLHSMEFLSHNIFPRVGGNCVDMPIPSKNLGFQSHHKRSMIFAGKGQMIPMINSFGPPSERARSCRNEGAVNLVGKKQYELDIDRILRGEDNRTTLMIKNIPNKYTSKMLLATIDECHKGTYNFIYLPIDFKNKCNVGYAFINMTDPSQIIPFYRSFNGKKWEKFNSEKVASLAYGRIQGKAALIAHFQNSSLMNEDKRCRPILFHTDGPNAGDRVPFPMGVNVRNRPGKPCNIIHEENYHGSRPNGEDSSCGGTLSGSAKVSD